MAYKFVNIFLSVARVILIYFRFNLVHSQSRTGRSLSEPQTPTNHFRISISHHSNAFNIVNLDGPIWMASGDFASESVN